MRESKESIVKDKVEVTKEKSKIETEKDKYEIEEISKDQEYVLVDMNTENEEDIPNELDNHPFFHGFISSDDLCFILSEVKFVLIHHLENYLQ